MDVRQDPHFFRGERIQSPVSCITRSKGGRRASSGLSTKEERLSTRIFAARLTTSICQFFADHFFRSEKKSTYRTPVARLCKYDYLFMSFTIYSTAFRKFTELDKDAVR